MTYSYEVHTEENHYDGMVKATVTLNNVPIYTGFYGLSGPDRFRDAADYAMDSVALALADLIGGIDR